MAFDFTMPFMGNMGDFGAAAMAWLSKLSVMSQLDFMGVLAVGTAVVLLLVSITGAAEEMMKQ
jgi:hypothetical protein